MWEHVEAASFPDGEQGLIVSKDLPKGGVGYHLFPFVRPWWPWHLFKVSVGCWPYEIFSCDDVRQIRRKNVNADLIAIRIGPRPTTLYVRDAEGRMCPLRRIMCAGRSRTSLREKMRQSSYRYVRVAFL